MIQWRLARYVICSPGIKFSSTYPIGSSSKPDQTLRQRSTKSTPTLFSSSSVLGSVTNLKAISTRILEKNGVVTGFPRLGNFISGSFDVPRSRMGSNLSQVINLADAVRPECNAALVGHMLRRLANAKKLRYAVSVVRFKL